MENSERQYVIGMAGHIDHGKTALIQALTGINTDRLKEEQQRGITIDLGFAHFSKNITIIDVPGHERLIKNMVAGVSTIDLVLFVVAADDGIMPQTREHLDIVKLLGITNGIFVITKIDLVEEDWVNLVEDELRNLLKNSAFGTAPIIKTSVVQEVGIPEVRAAIQRVLEQIPVHTDDGIFRLPIDRVFSLAGFGTVVTGSVLSGKIEAGDSVEILPQQLLTRVRGLQSHDSPVKQVRAGFRAAINLANVHPRELHRGQVITLPGYYQPVDLFNARLQLLESAPSPVKNQMRVRLHLHTSESFARVIIPGGKSIQPGESLFVQMRLEQPVYVSFGDRFVIRQYSPQVTLGGGQILKTNPVKFRKKYLDDFLRTARVFLEGSAQERLLACFSVKKIQPLSLPRIQVKIGLSEKDTAALISQELKAGRLFLGPQGKEKMFYSHPQLKEVLLLVESTLNDFHRIHPGKAGRKIKELAGQFEKRFPEALFQLALQLGVQENILRTSGSTVSLAKFEVTFSDRQLELLEEIEKMYHFAGFSPPAEKEICEQLEISAKDFREYLSILLEQGKLIFAQESLYFHSDIVKRTLAVLQEHFKKNRELRVSEFKELIRASRKFALPLLGYFDKKGYTRRQGDVRIAGEKLTASD